MMMYLRGKDHNPVTSLRFQTIEYGYSYPYLLLSATVRKEKGHLIEIKIMTLAK